MRRVQVAGLSLAAGIALFGCSSSGSTESANEAYCDALAELSQQVSELQDLVAGNATVEELEAQTEDVHRAATEVSKTAQGVDAAVADQVSGAVDDFEQAIDAIPADATLDEAAIAYRDAVSEYHAALKAELSQLGC